MSKADRLSVPIPIRMRKLRVDHRGFVIPLFLDEGEATDFRHMNGPWTFNALQKRLCGICGNRLGERFVFAGGPRSCFSGGFSDPPFHMECALYAAKVCPYILRAGWDRTESPHMQPSKERDPYGFLEAVPTYLYETRSYKLERSSNGKGLLIVAGPRIGEPILISPTEEIK